MGPHFTREIYDQGTFNRNYVECINTELRCQLVHSSRSFKISHIHKIKYLTFTKNIFLVVSAFLVWTFIKSTFDLSDNYLIEFGNFDIKREKLWIYEIINEESTVPFIELLKLSVKSTYTTVKGMQ